MSESGQKLGELKTFADVISRAVIRCGSRSELARLTGLSEQNLRRWGTQGEFPNFLTLMGVKNKLPEPMLIDFVTVFLSGTRFKVAVIAEEGSAEAMHNLAQETIDVQRHSVAMQQAVHDAAADGVIDSDELSNIQKIGAEGIAKINRVVKSVAMAAGRFRSNG